MDSEPKQNQQYICKKCKLELPDEELIELQNLDEKEQAKIKEEEEKKLKKQEEEQYQDFQVLDMEDVDQLAYERSMGNIRAGVTIFADIAFFGICLVFAFSHGKKIQKYFDDNSISMTDLEKIQETLDENGLNNMSIFAIDLQVIKDITFYLQFMILGALVLLNLAILIRRRGVDYPKTKKAFNMFVGLLTFSSVIMVFAWWTSTYDILRKTYMMEVDEDSQLKEVEFHISQQFIGYWGYSFKNWNEAQVALGSYSEFKSIDNVYKYCKTVESMPIYLGSVILFFIIIYTILAKIKFNQVRKLHIQRIKNLSNLDDENQNINVKQILPLSDQDNQNNNLSNPDIVNIEIDNQNQQSVQQKEDKQSQLSEKDININELHPVFQQAHQNQLIVKQQQQNEDEEQASSNQIPPKTKATMDSNSVIAQNQQEEQELQDNVIEENNSNKHILTEQNLSNVNDIQQQQKQQQQEEEEQEQQENPQKQLHIAATYPNIEENRSQLSQQSSSQYSSRQLNSRGSNKRGKRQQFNLDKRNSVQTSLAPPSNLQNSQKRMSVQNINPENVNIHTQIQELQDEIKYDDNVIDHVNQGEVDSFDMDNANNNNEDIIEDKISKYQ